MTWPAWDQKAYLDICSIVDDLLVLLETLILGTIERGESPFLGNNDLLATGELVSSTSESLDDDWSVNVLASNRHDHLTTKRR